MAYTKGDIIAAADINDFITRSKTLFGVGNGDRGYGQTTPNPALVAGPNIGTGALGDEVKSSTWVDLRTILSVISKHQTSEANPPLLPPVSVLLPGATIVAHEGIPLNPFNINSLLTTFDTNRLAPSITEMTVSSAVHVVTRSGGWPTTITTTVDVSFANENSARYYFNTGGQIRFVMAQPSGGAAQDVEWRNILQTKLGLMTLSARGFTMAGTSTTWNVGSTTGYYGISSTADTPMITATNAGSGAYTNSSVTITAKALSRDGVNGANGKTIRFIITLTDGHTNPNYDIVTSGTNVSFSTLRSNLPGIAAPTFVTATPF